ncbi:MAG TPA: glycoside hydrolase family 1 protein [Spirochaetota bacterium]|nr:glycoside hydrolase family 1 protein [Spirochaetota bacterium]
MAVLVMLYAFAVSLAVTVLYGIIRRPRPSDPVSISGQRFPGGFLWATGEDAYQHEGGNLANDWARWEAQEPSPIENGDRCGIAADFYNRYESDFDLAARDGQNAHRIGIEWSRLEPEKGRYDEEAFRRYDAMIDAMRRRGFTVFLNLWHFTLPLWAADEGGWESAQVMGRWEALVRQCATRFGGRVDYWSTMIDAQIYALAGYAVGEIPPNQKDIKRALSVYRTLIHAHARAYHLIKKHAAPPGGASAPRVGQIYFFFHYEPKGFLLDRVITRQMDRIFNENLLDALYTGTIELRVLMGPTVREHDDSIRGTLDWIGVNYYTREILSFNPLKPGFIGRKTCASSRTTDMGWEIYPEGIYRLCKKLEGRYPGVPLFIAESGLADAADDRRPRFILEHLAWVHRLIGEGCPITGFTHWSITDNWEWAKGFGPKFGLYRVNRETMERVETASARLYRFIAHNNRLPEESEIDAILCGHAGPVSS